MKSATKYKISSFLCLGLVLIGFNQCITDVAESKKSALKYSPNNTSGNAESKESKGTTGSTETTGSTGDTKNQENPGPSFTSAEVKAISIEAFKTTVYPITRARCVACHGIAGQSPLHAVTDITIAHDSLINNYKIDFTNIPNSRLILKIQNDKHNCWGNCATNGAEIQSAITEWRRLIDLQAPAATDSLTDLSGVATNQTESVANILNSKDLIYQGTINIAVESGSQKAPMVKASEGGQTYIWTPEGFGKRSLTSTSGGIGYINSKLTISDFYTVWMLVNAPDISSASAFVKVADSDFKDWRIKLTKGFEWRVVTTSSSYLDTPFYISNDKNFNIEIRQSDDGVKISKIAISNDVAFDPNFDIQKATISMPISTISGVPDSYFEIDIEEYDTYSYKVANPRIKTNKDIYVKNLKVLLNGSYNPLHATYKVVDKKITAADASLSAFSMVILKDKGLDNDHLSFSFEHIGTTPAPKTIKPPPVTTLPVVVIPPPPKTETPVVVKLNSVAGFQQTLWPVLRQNCASCHGVNQNPLHSSEDVDVAHTAVIGNSLVNFADIPNSKISKKLKNNEHHCWSDCNENALEVEDLIMNWKDLSNK